MRKISNFLEGMKINAECTSLTECEANDCISRAEAIRVASGYCHPSNVAKELAKLPSVTPQEPKTGHWITTGDYYTGAYGTIDYVECSCCHEESLEEGDYCPNCGAKMVEPQESED